MWRSMKRGIWTDEEEDKGGDRETGTEEDNDGGKTQKNESERESSEVTYSWRLSLLKLLRNRV